MSYYRDVQMGTGADKNVSFDVSDRTRNLSIQLTGGGGGGSGDCNLITKTTQEWAEMPTYIPGKKTIIVYSDAYHDGSGNPVPRVKIGDGQTVVGSLPFAGNDMPPGGFAGDILAKTSDADYNATWVTPANTAEQDNTRPITSAAVYTQIGNINALLATI